ncbi:MAG: septum formation initiator family protein [Taibaiella sp.]|nr:septum formation initiator family protein [Taibaiella sp.]
MRQALRFLYNKYFIAIAVFLVIMLVFDQNDWFTQWNRKKQLDEANKNIDFLKKEVAAMSEELHNLEHDPEVIKKICKGKILL